MRCGGRKDRSCAHIAGAGRDCTRSAGASPVASIPLTESRKDTVNLQAIHWLESRIKTTALAGQFVDGGEHAAVNADRTACHGHRPWATFVKQVLHARMIEIKELR